MKTGTELTQLLSSTVVMIISIIIITTKITKFRKTIINGLPDEDWHRVDTLPVRELRACHAQYNAPEHSDEDHSFILITNITIISIIIITIMIITNVVHIIMLLSTPMIIHEHNQKLTIDLSIAQLSCFLSDH